MKKPPKGLPHERQAGADALVDLDPELDLEPEVDLVALEKENAAAIEEVMREPAAWEAAARAHPFDRETAAAALAQIEGGSSIADAARAVGLAEEDVLLGWAWLGGPMRQAPAELAWFGRQFLVAQLRADARHGNRQAQRALKRQRETW